MSDVLTADGRTLPPGFAHPLSDRRISLPVPEPDLSFLRSVRRGGLELHRSHLAFRAREQQAGRA